VAASDGNGSGDSGNPLFTPSIFANPSPNPNIYGLVAIGLLLHTAIIISEIGLVWEK